MNESSLISQERLAFLMGKAQFGWWRADFTQKKFNCSGFILKLVGLDTDEPTFEQYVALIREDYRNYVSHNFFSIPEYDYHEHVFPMIGKHGEVWFSANMGSKEYDAEGNLIVWGTIQRIPSPDENERTVRQQRQLNNLLYRQNAISRSLLSFSKTENIKDVVTKILDDILIHFDAGRVYIFEFDEAKRTQSCTYETVGKGVSEEGRNLVELENSLLPWWTNKVKSGSAIIMESLEELPREAVEEKQILAAQNIKSIMVLPLRIDDKVWGYMGVDIVDHFKRWSNEDYQWFSSLANIISICIDQYNSRKQILFDKKSLENLYQYMPMAYVRATLEFDSEGRVTDYSFVDVNITFERITGMSKNDLLNRSAKELGLIKEGQLEYIELLIDKGEHMEQDIQLGNNKYVHCITYIPSENEIVALFTDVTDSVKAQEALNHNEEILRNIYNHIPVGIELYDKDGFLVNLNKKDMELFGIESKQDVLGLCLFENPNIPSAAKETLRRKEPLSFRTSYSFKRAEGYLNVDKQGILDIYCNATLLYDSKGNVVNFLVINIDNTETILANNKIRDFESMFSVIADFAKVGFLRWNPLTKEGFAIEQWFKNYGSESRNIEDIVGDYPTVHPEDRKWQRESYREMLQGKRHNYSRELRVITPDGSIKWIRSTVIAKKFELENEQVELIGVNFDITELKNVEKMLIKAKEKAEEADKLKSAFLANMSHEIRTPLNAIVGFSNLLVDADTDEEKKQYISIVEENNDLLLKLISDILDLSKIEAGMFEIENSEVDLNQLCSDIVRSVSLKAHLGVEVIFENHLPGGCYLLSDKNRLHQIIANLANNSLKFTTEGYIAIGYDIREDEIEFYVRDTGIGIPYEQQSEIFGRFVKLNSFVHGTGLGLSICSSIVEQFGGRMGVNSEQGKGSRFWFTHPINKNNIMIETDLNFGQLGSKENESVDRTGDRPVILVAEDTDSNYLLVSTILRKDYTLHRAIDGNEVVKMHQELHPDLILMDIRMPNKNGIEATKEIRQKDNYVPIIALTAFAYDQDRQKTLEAGCNDYVTKPLSPAALKKVIAEWIKGGE